VTSLYLLNWLTLYHVTIKGAAVFHRLAKQMLVILVTVPCLTVDIGVRVHRSSCTKEHLYVNVIFSFEFQKTTSDFYLKRPFSLSHTLTWFTSIARSIVHRNNLEQVRRKYAQELRRE
jgi:hypothetical protein